MRNRIRLTEGQLRRVVKESVYRILSEGQGWNKFKSTTRDIFNGKNDDYLANDDWKKDIRKDKDSWIKNGHCSSVNDFGYYDEEGDPQQQKYDGEKKINKGFMGRLGRRAAYHGINAAANLRSAWNKFKS